MSSSGPQSLGPPFTQAREGAVALFWNALEPPTVLELCNFQAKGQNQDHRAFLSQVVPAPALGLMWLLALSVAVLEAAQACLFCRLPAHGLSGRLARLCSQIEAQWKDCEASWNFSTFALDEVSMNKVTEKTHRVLRVMEIKRSFSSLPLYWQWLQETKFPEYNREALCSPACWGSTILYNCSTCEGFEVLCWPQKRCFPGSHDLREARILLLCVFGTILLLGVLSLVVEFHFLEAKSDL